MRGVKIVCGARVGCWIAVLFASSIQAPGQCPTGEALDSPALLWINFGATNWFCEFTDTHDGVDALQSGSISDGQLTRVQTTVTGPGTVTFWWKVSSEADSDFLTYSDSVNFDFISGVGGGWGFRSFNLPPGSHSLRWTYEKNDSCCSAGSDAGWLDEVSWTPSSIVGFTSEVHTVAENVGIMTAWVHRIGFSNLAASVQYATSNGTAVTGADYIAAAGTLAWAINDAAPKPIAVSITWDAATESGETFSIELKNPTNALLDATATTVVTIVHVPASGDADGDDISDWWESLHYGGLTNANPNAMASNGVNTVLEAWIADLNPTNPASQFLITTVSNLPGGVASVVATPGSTGRVYQLYSTTNLSALPLLWPPYGPLRTGTGAAVTFIVTNEVSHRAYRTGVQVP